MKIRRGSTSVRRLIFIADSSSTTGAGLANLVHNSAGLTAWYMAGDLSADVQIPLVTATLGTYTSGGFIAVDNANMPGWYEIGIPNAALDGGNECAIQIRGAANMVPVNIWIELDAVDYQSATNFGLSNLDAAISTRSTFAGGAVASVTGSVGSVVGNVGGNVVGSVGSVAGNVSGSVASVTAPVTVGTINANTVNASALATDAVTEIVSAVWANATRTITGGTISTVSDKTGYELTQAFPANFAALGINASGHISRVVLVDTTTTNTDMRGTNNALLAASYVAPANATISDISSRLPAALVGGRMDSSVGAMAANTLTASALASDAVTEIAGAVSAGGGASVSDIFSESMSTYTTPGTAGYYLSLIMADNINRELQPETNELVYITRGDSYDNVANAKKTFAVSKNYIGWTGAFVIRHRVTDAVLLSVAVEVTSATLLTIALSATDTAFASLASAEEYGPHPFAIEMVSGSSRQEGPSGIAIVVQDQAR